MDDPTTHEPTTLKPPHESKLMTTVEVAKLLRIHRHRVHGMVATHGLPRPIRLNARTFRWRADELDAWLIARQAA